MKITREHRAIMQQAIVKVLANNPDLINNYECGHFNKADKVKDLQRRFCFDLSYFAGLTKFYCDVIYKYADDDHIYTALKSICPTITKQY